MPAGICCVASCSALWYRYSDPYIHNSHHCLLSMEIFHNHSLNHVFFLHSINFFKSRLWELFSSIDLLAIIISYFIDGFVHLSSMHIEPGCIRQVTVAQYSLWNKETWSLSRISEQSTKDPHTRIFSLTLYLVLPMTVSTTLPSR